MSSLDSSRWAYASWTRTILITPSFHRTEDSCFWQSPPGRAAEQPCGSPPQRSARRWSSEASSPARPRLWPPTPPRSPASSSASAPTSPSASSPGTPRPTPRRGPARPDRRARRRRVPGRRRDLRRHRRGEHRHQRRLQPPRDAHRPEGEHGVLVPGRRRGQLVARRTPSRRRTSRATTTSCSSATRRSARPATLAKDQAGWAGHARTSPSRPTRTPNCWSPAATRSRRANTEAQWDAFLGPRQAAPVPVGRHHRQPRRRRQGVRAAPLHPEHRPLGGRTTPTATRRPTRPAATTGTSTRTCCSST